MVDLIIIDFEEQFEPSQELKISYHITNPSLNHDSRFDTFHDSLWIQSSYFDTRLGRYTVSIASKFDFSLEYHLRLVWKQLNDPISIDKSFQIKFSSEPSNHPKLAGYGLSYETLKTVRPQKLAQISNLESLNNRFLVYASLKNGSSDIKLFEVQNNLESWVQSSSELNIPHISALVIAPLTGNDCWVGAVSNSFARKYEFRIWCYQEQTKAIVQRRVFNMDQTDDLLFSEDSINRNRLFIQPDFGGTFDNPFNLSLLAVGKDSISKRILYSQMRLIDWLFNQIE